MAEPAAGQAMLLNSGLAQASRCPGNGQRKNAMKTFELTLELPDRLAREAQAAGLLTPRALSRLLKDAMQRRAAQSLLAGAARATAIGSKPLSIKQIQAEIDSVRQAQRVAKGNTSA